MDTVTETEVLIVGAGPTGLSCAIELGLRGIRCMVIEKNDRVGSSPRAKTTNVRSCEHLRRWGIAKRLREASPLPPGYPSNVVFATRMNGHLLARIEDAFNTDPAKNNLYSESAQWVPQYVLEEILKDFAASLPTVSIAFDTELMSVERTSDFIASTAKRSDKVAVVRSRFLLGADGARSTVRQLIGARMSGPSEGLKNLSIIFRSEEIAKRHSFGPAVMYWMVNDDIPSLMGPMDRSDLWYFMATKIGADLEHDPAELIRKSSGLHDLKLEVVARDPWTANQLVADSYGANRIFLLGDACHLHPPFGGFGMNLGISDAVDIGWKIAATLQGWGGPGLLASYELERKSVHQRTITEAGANYAVVSNQLVRPSLEHAGEIGNATRKEVGEIIAASKIREFKSLGLVLGSRYRNSPIIFPEDCKLPDENTSLYLPTACPGGLAPHLWLADGTSLYDHFGPGFTLLVTAEVAAETIGLNRAAKTLNLPLKVLAPGDLRLRDRYQANFALIRPDQYVAWRGDALPTDAGGLLRHVIGAA
jgi:2-polyprenyl-6-methoxyphenol hydroxylase-like FAD-dependent oxidoreductase